MSIFSRRDLQRMIDSLDGKLRADQLARLIREIESYTDASIHAEWELVVLTGLSRFGYVEHEPSLGGRSRVDFSFSTSTYRGFGDVATVTNKGYEEENPVEAFQKELFRRTRKHGVSAGGFELEIGRRTDGSYGAERIRALVPRPQDYSVAFGAEFYRFLDAVRDQPNVRHFYHMVGPGFDVRLTVGLDKRHVVTHSPGYTVSYDIERNPLMNTLRRKARQLKEIDFDGPAAIVICDGHADVIRRRLSSGSGAIGVDEVVRLFFTRTGSIDLVAVFGIEREPSRGMTPAGQGPPVLRVRTLLNPRTPYEDEASRMAEVFESVPRVLPRPRIQVINAVAQLTWPDPTRGWSFRGGWSMQFDKEGVSIVKISSRHLLELLAGRVTPEEYLRESRNFAALDGSKNLFASALDQGRMIEHVEVERAEHEDDDWLIVHFGPPDPAVTTLRVPPPRPPDDETPSASG